jgi:hypothetical protein
MCVSIHYTRVYITVHDTKRRMVGPSVSLADPRHWLVALENHPPVAYYVPCCSLDLSFLQPFFLFLSCMNIITSEKSRRKKRKKEFQRIICYNPLFLSLSPISLRDSLFYALHDFFFLITTFHILVVKLKVKKKLETNRNDAVYIHIHYV